MAFLKKLAAFIVLLVACGYVSMLWEEHRRNDAVAEKLVRELGNSLVAEMGAADQVCRGVARIDTIAIKRGWFESSGAAKLYIAGRGNAATSIEYTIEVAGERVYVQPIDPDRSRQAVIDFVMRRCS